MVSVCCGGTLLDGLQRTPIFVIFIPSVGLMCGRFSFRYYYTSGHTIEEGKEREGGRVRKEEKMRGKKGAKRTQRIHGNQESLYIAQHMSYIGIWRGKQSPWAGDV